MQKHLILRVKHLISTVLFVEIWFYKDICYWVVFCIVMNFSRWDNFTQKLGQFIKYEDKLYREMRVSFTSKTHVDVIFVGI